MSDITRQDIQGLLQQFRDNILDRLATRSDQQAIYNEVTHKPNKNEVSAIVEQSTQKLLAVTKEQQNTIRSLSDQINKLTNLVSDQEFRIKAIEKDLKGQVGTMSEDYYDLQRKIFDRLYTA